MNLGMNMVHFLLRTADTDLSHSDHVIIPAQNIQNYVWVQLTPRSYFWNYIFQNCD